MQGHSVVHLLLFVIFFSIGAATLGGAVLCDDLIRYCRNKHLVREAEVSLERLESLNAEYDALLQQLENDPAVLNRIAPVTLGIEPNDPNAIYPRARAHELAVARRALLAQAGHEPQGPAIPMWLQRCSEPTKKIALFIAGAALILISLVCFTPRKSEPG